MMKTLNDYMAMSYRMEIVEDKDEGGFVVSYPDLPGCITCGETVESAVANALDAKKAWIEAALEEGVEPGYLHSRRGCTYRGIGFCGAGEAFEGTGAFTEQSRSAGDSEQHRSRG